MTEATVRELAKAAIIALFVAGPIVGIIVHRRRGGHGIVGGAAGGFSAAFLYFGGYCLRYFVPVAEVGHDEPVALILQASIVMTVAITLLGGLVGVVVWALFLLTDPGPEVVNHEDPLERLPDSQARHPRRLPTPRLPGQAPEKGNPGDIDSQ